MNETERAFINKLNRARGQAPSTQACLDRPKELDLVWLSRPIPKEAQVVKEDGSVDLNIRQFTKQEFDFFNQEYGASKIYGRVRERGKWFEEARGMYLRSAKIHDKLKDRIDTPHVMPDAEKRERASEAFMKVGIIQKIKDKFKELMFGVKREPSYAEKIAAGMRALNEE